MFYFVHFPNLTFRSRSHKQKDRVFYQKHHCLNSLESNVFENLNPRLKPTLTLEIILPHQSNFCSLGRTFARTSTIMLTLAPALTFMRTDVPPDAAHARGHVNIQSTAQSSIESNTQSTTQSITHSQPLSRAFSQALNPPLSQPLNQALNEPLR